MITWKFNAADSTEDKAEDLRKIYIHRATYELKGDMFKEEVSYLSFGIIHQERTVGR